MMTITRKNCSTLRKICPVLPCSSHIAFGLSWDWNWASRKLPRLTHGVLSDFAAHCLIGGITCCSVVLNTFMVKKTLKTSSVFKIYNIIIWL
jgi:hypothetical protein